MASITQKSLNRSGADYRGFIQNQLELLRFRFQVHRLILKQSSPYFAGLLRSPTKENCSRQLVIPDTSEAAVEGVIDFIYTSRLAPACHVTPGLVGLFALAHR